VVLGEKEEEEGWGVRREGEASRPFMEREGRARERVVWMYWFYC
jgi:hypothetical protein